MRTLFTTMLIVQFLSANAQDYIRTDFPIETPPGIQIADLMFSPGGDAILRADFEFISLLPGFAPASEVVDLRPDYIGAYFKGSSYFAENEMAVLWSHSKYVGSEIFDFLYMQIFDTLSNSLTPEIAVDSVKGGGFIFINMAALPDNDDDIGIAWTSADTLYSIYFNAATRLLSDKQKLLTGVTTYSVQMADFMQNGDVRIIWHDIDKNTRHKRLTKTGTVINDESVLYGDLNYWSFTKYVSVSMQDNGKSAVLWSPYGYDYTNNRMAMFLQMQFLDENNNRIGEPFQPVKVNTESYNLGYEIAEQYPFVRLVNDTAWLLWSNYNEEFSSSYSKLYMNIQRLTEPVVSGISTVNRLEMNHWVTFSRASGELMLTIETPAACPATFEVIDMLGRPVGSAVNMALQPGMNKVMLSNNTLQLHQKGVFLYRMHVNGNLYQGKFLK